MRYGLFGGPIAPPGVRTERDAYDGYADYVVAAERLGFEGVFLTEHHFTGLGQVSTPLGLLSYLAGRTSAIRLGTAVSVLNWYNPITIAEQAATVDLVSGGRLDFGVGRGFRAAEYEGFCIPMDEAQARYDEALEVILKAWSSSERWSHDGPFWRYENVISEPRPLQQPGPPVWMGAGSEKSLRHAAEHGFNLLLDQIASFETVAERVAVYRDRQRELGMDPSEYDVAVTRGLCIVDSDEERERAIEDRAVAMNAIASLAKGSGTAPQNRMTADYMTDVRESTEAGTIIGDPHECAERLDRLAEGGVDYVLLSEMTSSSDILRRFAEEVSPLQSAVLAGQARS
jgi:alkanesulfonate monooxygenase SsuD/methylene tetrahydromethanopterin reductase-like flavin-dependent oxidoreductase (luciferase family)